MILVVMGASGAGKTTVGRALAEKLRWPFLDADDFHSAENISKMAHGIPLTDDDRRPWLEGLRVRLEELLAKGEPAVLACSALKESYRLRLRVSPEVKFVFLNASRALLEQRLAQRQGHYMKAGMVQSQLEALEPPQEALVVDAARPVGEIVQVVIRTLGLSARPQ